ncbi:MAG: NADH-quinone oxidoreductase subunit C [Planctomycetota bacterium]|nr:NADH-quinone oxidoreductase subunit C [Planctomycetota bacterium]
MNAQEIINALTARFARGVLASQAEGTHPHATIAPEAWLAVAEFLRDEPAMRFDFLRAVSGVDYPAENQLVSVYDLISTVHRHTFAVKVAAARDNPHTPSVSGVWPTADWHEREAFDLLGIVYDGHPELRRILLPEDWQGHPLRKDYAWPKDYNGIPCASLVNP